jgi:hypothetical protein
MAEIATWSAILNKTGLGKTSNECPTKAELLALNNGKDSNVDKVIVISNAANYGNNECVKLEDINAEQWIYTFEWKPDRNPSFNAPATGGEYYVGTYDSNRTKYVNGKANPNIVEYVSELSRNDDPSWYSYSSDNTKRIVPNNTSTNSRSHTTVITQKYSGKTIQATFTQAAGSKVYSSWSYNCRVDKTSFSYSGGQSNVTAKSASRTYTWNGQGSSYTESETATVRVSSPASISGNSITIPSNSDSARNFTVTFDFPTATDQTISISQEGGQVSYVDHLSIDPTTKNVSGSGQTFDVIVNANYDKYLNGVYQENIKSQYTNATVVSGSSSDITITRTSTGCSIKVAPNPNESSSRTYVVEFTYDSATPVRLTITQNKGVVSYPDSGYSLTQSTLRDSGFSTNALRWSSIDHKGSSFTVYLKSYRIKYINGINTGIRESIQPSINPSASWIKYRISNLGQENLFEVSFTVQENTEASDRSGSYSAIITGNNEVFGYFDQEAGEVYELYFNNPDGSGYYTDFTFNSPGKGYAGNVARLTSALNGQHLPADSVEVVETTNMNWCILASSETNSPFMLVAAIVENGPTKSRDTKQVYRQKATGKLATINIHQARGEYPSFRLELSLNIINGNDQDTWGLFDTANIPHTSDFMYDMSLIREGIIVDSVEGKITVNSIQSTTKDIEIGDNVYVWAYNSVRGLWLSIGNFRIEEGDNTHHWDVSWP